MCHMQSEVLSSIGDVLCSLNGQCSGRGEQTVFLEDGVYFDTIKNVKLSISSLCATALTYHGSIFIFIVTQLH